MAARQPRRAEGLGEIVDRVGMEAPRRDQDKIVAMLLVLAVESVKAGERAPEYRDVEPRWMAGDTAAIVAESRGRGRIDAGVGRPS